MKLNNKKKWYITVNMHGNGRGLFSTRFGKCCVQDMIHTTKQINDVMGAFALIFIPMSEEFSEEEIEKHTKWFPLPEFNNQWGVAVKNGE